MDRAQCLSRLQRLCSKTEYCAQDMYRKALKDLEGDTDAAAAVVASLIEDRYVDDARYAAAFAREKAGIQGWGPVKIRFQLRSKGISDEIIASALVKIKQLQIIDRNQLLINVKNVAACRLKLLKFALSRGYEYDEVEAALKEIFRSS